MIDIQKDSNSGCYVITQTRRIEGIDFHSQMTLTEEEMTYLYTWCKAFEDYIIQKEVNFYKIYGKENQGL